MSSNVVTNFATMAAVTNSNYQGGAGTPNENTGPKLADYAARYGQASVSFEHAAGDTGYRYILRAPDLEALLLDSSLADIGELEVIGATVRAENGWGAGTANSEDLILWTDDDAGGGKTVIATIDGTTDTFTADQGNYWPDLPGVTGPGPYATVPAGGMLGLELTTNAAGFTLGHVTVTVFYRLK